jgi:hypothetical protein
MSKLYWNPRHLRIRFRGKPIRVRVRLISRDRVWVQGVSKNMRWFEGVVPYDNIIVGHW